MINAAIIGYGYWGPNLVRNFSEHAAASVAAICDSDASRLKAAKARHPAVRVAADAGDVLHDDAIELVAIATPVQTHYRLAREALLAGKHVLLEKPMTASVAQAEKLVNLAEKTGRLLFVDHTYVFTGAVKHMKEMVASGAIGDMYYFDSVRVNLGLFQRDVNVLWDLAPHDFSILDHLIGEQPAAVSAIGAARVHPELEEVAYITVRFRSGLIAHFHVNWMSPVKIRRTILGGSRKMVVFDELSPDEKIKVYDKGVSLSLQKASRDRVHHCIVQYRIGDMYSPRIDSSEALKTEVDHIVACIEGRGKPLASGAAGLRVVRLLEAAAKSLKKGGRFVTL
ncbi:MAG: oxidoreductase domain protein [Nitrospirae bacterium]|nr:MAG: oxidoreductase domain protein [Nitrospirota bacterium]